MEKWLFVREAQEFAVIETDRRKSTIRVQSDRMQAGKVGQEVELARGPDFLRLANALSALYPRESEEKRLLDAMLLAAPRG